MQWTCIQEYLKWVANNIFLQIDVLVSVGSITPIKATTLNSWDIVCSTIFTTGIWPHIYSRVSGWIEQQVRTSGSFKHQNATMTTEFNHFCPLRLGGFFCQLPSKMTWFLVFRHDATMNAIESLLINAHHELVSTIIRHCAALKTNHGCHPSKFEPSLFAIQSCMLWIMIHRQVIWCLINYGWLKALTMFQP